MDKKYSVTPIDNKTFTEEDWKAYFKANVKYAKYKGFPLPFPSWIELKEHTLTMLKDGFGIYMVSKDNQSIGYFTFDIRLKDEADRRYVYFSNGLTEDLDTGLLKIIYRAFMVYDSLSKFMVIKSLNGQYEFLEKTMNAAIGDNLEQYELKVSDANLEVINNWYETYSEKFKDFELRHYEDIPDDLLEEYCAVFLELLHDMPSQSKINDFEAFINPEKIKALQVRSKKINKGSYRYLVFDESKLIAKTNVSLSKKNPQRMYQYMTGVLKNYRKSGMGKWLKAAMFIKLTQDFPGLEMIKTEIHPNNIPSQKLSLQMGYEKVGFFKEYLISRKAIEKFL